MAKKVEIGTEIGRGWNLFKGNMGLLVLVGLLGVVAGLLTCGILMGPMLAGTFLIIQRLLKNDPVVPQVGDVFKGFEYFLNAFLLILVTSIIFAIPGVNVLGIVAAPIMMIGVMFITFGKMSFSETLKKIFNEISTGPFWMLVLTVWIGCVIGNLGSLLCGIGVFFTMPLAACIFVCAYHSAYGEDGVAEQQTPPPVGPPPAEPPPPPPEPQG